MPQEADKIFFCVTNVTILMPYKTLRIWTEH